MLGCGRRTCTRVLGYDPGVWHMNEGTRPSSLWNGHANWWPGLTFEQAIAQTRIGNVFTTHTPVRPGNDEFPLWAVDKTFRILPELGLAAIQFVNLAKTSNPGAIPSACPSWLCEFGWPQRRLGTDGRVPGACGSSLGRRWKGRGCSDHIRDHGVHTATGWPGGCRVLLNKHLGENWMEAWMTRETWIRMGCHLGS